MSQATVWRLQKRALVCSLARASSRQSEIETGIEREGAKEYSSIGSVLLLAM